MADEFFYTTPLHPLAQPLVEQLTWEYATRYGSQFGEPPGAEMSRYPAELFAPPDGNIEPLRAAWGSLVGRPSASSAQPSGIGSPLRARRITSDFATTLAD